MIIERLKDDSKKKMVGDLQIGQCFLFDDEDSPYMKTDETDDHSLETLCVDLEEGIVSMVTNSTLVIPVTAKAVIEV